MRHYLAKIERLTLSSLLCLWLTASTPNVAATPIVPTPFDATYNVYYRGFRAGNLSLTLEKTATPGKYTYEMSVDPSFFARLAVNSAATERSELEIGPDGVRPLHWELDDGTRDTDEDGVIDFDWQAGRAKGTYQGEPVATPTEPNLQDRLSVQIAVMTALLRGQAPGTIAMMDGPRSKQYTYEFVNETSIKTPYGTLDTVLYESKRPGSNRLSRVWYAPSLGYLAVRAEQIRKGKLETVMVLSKLAKE